MLTLTIKDDIIYALKEAKLMYSNDKDNIIETASRLSNVPTSWVIEVYNEINKGDKSE